MICWRFSSLDSASKENLARQVGQSPEKRGEPRAEDDGPRTMGRDVTPDFLLASNRTHRYFEKGAKKGIWNCMHGISPIFTCRLINNPG